MAERFVLDSTGLQANRGFGRVRHTRAGARRACRRYVAIANADTAPRRNVWRKKVVMGRILIDRASENPASPHVSRHSVASIFQDPPRSAGTDPPGFPPFNRHPCRTARTKRIVCKPLSHRVVNVTVVDQGS
jgi:hypothetical protein